MRVLPIPRQCLNSRASHARARLRRELESLLAEDEATTLIDQPFMSEANIAIPRINGPQKTCR